MIRIARIALVLALLTACTGYTGQAQSRKGFVLTSREGKFSVTLPPGFEKPEQSVEESEDENGEPSTTTTYTAGNERGACLVSFTRNESFNGVESSALLDGARDGAIEEIGQGLDTQEDFMFGKYQARMVTFTSSTEDGTPLYSKFVWIIAQPYLYQIAFVAVDPDDLEADDIQQFFDSFTLKSPSSKKKR